MAVGGATLPIQQNTLNYEYSEGKPLIREPVYTLDALTRTRPVTAESGHGGPELARCLTWVDLITYGLGSTVGAGIFVITGSVAQNIAGPAVILSFLMAGLASLISAFCYSEFSARIPLSGSAYTFAYATLGELVGWFIGWDLTVEYAISASAIAQAWNGTFVQLLKLCRIHTPAWLGGTDIGLFALYPLSAFIVIGCTLILLLGVKDSARFNMIITVLNMSTIIFLIVVGATQFKIAYWANFMPFGINGVIQGAGKVFFSYIGFDSVTTLAGEVAKPKRDLPIGIVGTLVIATSLYILASGVLTGMLPYYMLDQTAPFSDAFTKIGFQWAASIVIVGSLTTMTAATLCSLLGQPRIYFQMAKDGLLWPAFGALNRFQSPYIGTIVTGVFSTFFALFWNIDELGSMISVGTLLAFTLVCGGVILLRYNDTDQPPSRLTIILCILSTFSACIVFGLATRFQLEWYFVLLAFVYFLMTVGLLFFLKPTNIYVRQDVFSCPWVPLLPSLGMLFNTVMIVQLDIDALIRVVVWAAVGMLIYFTYGIKHSVLRIKAY